MPLRLDRRVEDVLGELWPCIEPHMRSRRRHQAGAAGAVCKLVMDGHQNLTRRCCGIFCGGVTKSVERGKFCLHPCPATPLVRGRWCARHAALLREPVELPQKSQHSDRVRVRRMECLGRGLHELIRVDVSSAGDGRSTRVIPTSESWTALQSTLVRAASDEALRHRAQDASAEGPENPILDDIADDTPLLELAEVACKTHKTFAKTEDVAKKGHKLAMRRTGGFLVACTPTGTIDDLVEFFGAESLAQKCSFLARLKTTFPELHVLIHDDACHLRRYASNREGHSTFAQTLSYLDVAFVIDKFHARGHVDPWCSQHCAPRTTENAQLVCNANTSICEITFAWLARYKHMVRKMGEWTSKFFVSLGAEA